MADGVSIRRLGFDDLPAYKTLRDDLLEQHPEAFTSDAAAERPRRAEDYLPRLGLEQVDAGRMLLGAWHGGVLVGAIGLDRDARVKVRHVGHVIGMMVAGPLQRRGIGRALLDALIDEVRCRPAGLELLTLTVTDGNDGARRLYERAGFERFGLLPHAIKVGSAYHAKAHMVLHLDHAPGPGARG